MTTARRRLLTPDDPGPTVPVIHWQSAGPNHQLWWGTAITGYTFGIDYRTDTQLWHLTRTGSIPPGAHRRLGAAPTLAAAQQAALDWLAEPRRRHGR